MLLLNHRAIRRVPPCLFLGRHTLTPTLIHSLARLALRDLTRLGFPRPRRVHPFAGVRSLLLHNALTFTACALPLVHRYAPFPLLTRPVARHVA